MTISSLELGWICNVIPVLSSHCNFGGVTFFTVTTIVRFYMMVVQKSLPTARRMSRNDLAIGGVIIASTFAWIFGWTGRIYLVAQIWLEYWLTILYNYVARYIQSLENVKFRKKKPTRRRGRVGKYLRFNSNL